MILKAYNVSDTSDGKVNHERLNTEIASSGLVTNYQSILTNSTNIKVMGDSVSDESALDVVIGDHVGLTLDEAKSIREGEIDYNTDTLFENGFIFDSEHFGLSEEDQQNWIALDALREDLTYPFEISKFDGSAYEFASAADLHNFALTAMGTGNYHYSTGRALKASVNAATSFSELDAVVDNR